MAVRIRLLGRPEIRDGAGRRQPVRGLQSWAVLARVLLSARSPSRRELAAELFPETADPLASLRWCLASLRRALGCAEALRGDPIEPGLPPGAALDVRELERGDEAIDALDLDDLLAGQEPRCGPELATWLLVERQRIAGLIDARLRQDAIQALCAGDHERALALSERAVHRRPLDEGAHVLLVKSLTLAGRHEAAMAHVEATEKTFEAELGTGCSPALRSAARRSVAAPPGGVPPAAVARSLLEAGRAALAAGASDAGLDCLRRAVVEAERGAGGALHASALLELGTALVHAVRSHDDEGSITLRQAVATARDAGAADIAVAALRELGYVDALAGRRPASARHLAEALELVDGADEDAHAGVLAVSAFNLADWGRTGEAAERYGQALELARSAGSRRREAWTLGLGGWGRLLAGEAEQARAWLQECIAIVDELRWVAFRPWPIAVLAETRLALGDEAARVRAELEETFALSCQLADPCWEGAAARALALAHVAHGEPDRALTWIGQARERCLRETDTYVGLHGAILATQAGILRALGRPDEMAASARTLLSLGARAHMDARVRQALDLLGELEEGPCGRGPPASLDSLSSCEGATRERTGPH